MRSTMLSSSTSETIVKRGNGIWLLSLEQIEATVADHLGNGRVPGNQSAPCLSRQVSMCLAKNADVAIQLLFPLLEIRHHIWLNPGDRSVPGQPRWPSGSCG
jgi:hypothetical protein